MTVMTDRRDDRETGFDQTNGLADGLEGDDGGAVDPTPDKNVIGDVIGALADPDGDLGTRRDGDAEREADDPGDGAEGETPYSEEGKP